LRSIISLRCEKPRRGFRDAKASDKKELILLDEFLDNQNGYLYEVWSEISVIYQLLELKKEIDINDVSHSIEKMKEIFSYFSFKNLFIGNQKIFTKKKLMVLLNKQNNIINDYLSLLF